MNPTRLISLQCKDLKNDGTELIISKISIISYIDDTGRLRRLLLYMKHRIDTLYKCIVEKDGKKKDQFEIDLRGWCLCIVEKLHIPQVTGVLFNFELICGSVV